MGVNPESDMKTFIFSVYYCLLFIIENIRPWYQESWFTKLLAHDTESKARMSIL